MFIFSFKHQCLVLFLQVAVSHSVVTTVPSHLGCSRSQSDLHPLTFQPLVMSSSSKDSSHLDRKTDIVKYLSVGCCMVDSGQFCDGILTEKESGDSKVTSLEWSCPVRLITSEGGSRMTLTLSVRSRIGMTYKPLCVSGVEENGITFLTVEVDKAPSCFIENQCSFPLFFGQTLMNLTLKGKCFESLSNNVHTFDFC